MLEGGKAGAKIVDGEAKTVQPQARHGLERARDVGQRGGFKDFKGHVLGFHAMPGNECQHFFAKAFIGQR